MKITYLIIDSILFEIHLKQKLHREISHNCRYKLNDSTPKRFIEFICFRIQNSGRECALIHTAYIAMW